MEDPLSWMESSTPRHRMKPENEYRHGSHTVAGIVLAWSLSAMGSGWRLYGEHTIRLHSLSAGVSSEWRLGASGSPLWEKLGIAFGFEGPPDQVKAIIGRCVSPLQYLSRSVGERLGHLREERDGGATMRERIKVCFMGTERELGIQLAHRLAEVSLEAERPLWESARFVPAAEMWSWGGKQAWESVEAVLWWQFRDAPRDWADGAHAIVIAHDTDTNPAQIRNDVLAVQEALTEVGSGSCNCPIFLVVSGEAAKGDPWWIVRSGEEAGCAHAMGLIAAGACHFGGEEAAIDGVWPCTLKPDYSGAVGEVDRQGGRSRDGITVLREALASSAVLFQQHQAMVLAGQTLVKECEPRIASLASLGSGQCLQCAEPLLPLWRPAVTCAKCRLNFCSDCVVARCREDITKSVVQGGTVVHLCHYCTKVLNWHQAHEAIGDGHAAWRAQGRLAIVDVVDSAMQEIAQIQKAHLMKQLLG